MTVWLSLCNDIAVTLFGVVLSASFCGVEVRKKPKFFVVCMTILSVMQTVLYAGWGEELLRRTYPLVVHLPLFLCLGVLTRRWLWPGISVLCAYLCCQLRRWVALAVVAVLSGTTAMQDAIELMATLPLLLLLLRIASPPIRQLQDCPAKIQLHFGLVPATYYIFDYATVIYTDLLVSGSYVVAEFMPFVCCGAYLVFLIYYSAEERRRNQLQQVQKGLNLQLTQSVREIQAMRESQELAGRYRHDLRHHLQYVSTCIENGQSQQALEYISGICEQIEAQKVRRYCENETVNLILSSFAGRAQTHGIAMDVQGGLPKTVRIADSDLCVLFSNALENAIHACLPQAEAGKECAIQIRMYHREDQIFLQVSNPVEGEVRFQDGVPVTDEPEHGLGVQSICAIVQRYGGVCSFLVEDGNFLLRLSV